MSYTSSASANCPRERRTNSRSPDGRHNPYHKPLLGREELLSSLNESLRYIPYSAPQSDRSANYFSRDYNGGDLNSATWVFIGQSSAELYPSQMAKLLIATAGVDPVVATKNHTVNCMFVNLRSHADVNKVLNTLKRRLLLDYDGAWLASSIEGELTLAQHCSAWKLPNLPTKPITVEVCEHPPHCMRARAPVSSSSVPPMLFLSATTSSQHAMNHVERGGRTMRNVTWTTPQAQANTRPL
ncbi:Hypothetical protein, putative [Bodo saltans]|uniref:Uncharacterized protein n=1 Tax=Bodo saltans TaxID=75058 RepID=A0A0S4JZW8_BODSA|nr:Hypothetical protein, putative [Bodo saltans]|eukprot:CUG94134.1 Hypothetical protein, putative [Bodo saltans]